MRRLALLPALVSFVMLWPALLNQGVLAPTDIVSYDPLTGGYPPGDRRPVAENPVLTDPADSLLPWRLYARSELEAGRFPLWASGPLGGYPLFAHYQPGALNPLHLLWAMLPTGVGFGVVMLLKLWLAGMGMWFFLRALDLRPEAALLGALGFMFSAGAVGLYVKRSIQRSPTSSAPTTRGIKRLMRHPEVQSNAAPTTPSVTPIAQIAQYRS